MLLTLVAIVSHLQQKDPLPTMKRTAIIGIIAIAVMLIIGRIQPHINFGTVLRSEGVVSGLGTMMWQTAFGKSENQIIFVGTYNGKGIKPEDPYECHVPTVAAEGLLRPGDEIIIKTSHGELRVHWGKHWQRYPNGSFKTFLPKAYAKDGGTLWVEAKKGATIHLAVLR